LIALLGAGAAGAQELRYPVGMLGKFTPDGMLIQKVISGKPADKAGIESGDLILKVDGRLILSQEEFNSVINSSGGQVVFVVKKGNNGRTVRVGLDLSGTSKQGPPAPYFLGVTGKFTPDGMLIATTVPATPAAKVGLDKGDLIVRINNLPILNQNDFFTVLYASGGSVTLTVKKANGKLIRQDVSLTTWELGILGDFTRDGMVIGVVAPNTPAAYVGLQKGDVILRIDNQPVRSQKDFDRLINNSGGAVTLLVSRGGQRPVRMEVELMNNQLGTWTEPSSEGMRITAVVPGGPADVLGLRRGDTLLRIDEQRVTTQGELVRALRNARGLVTLTYRDGQTRKVVKADVDLAR